MNLFRDKKNIHFVGIGGSGMFPIAQILLKQNFNISGSDFNYSTTLTKLQEENVKIFQKHEEKNVENAELIVYSAAIREDNPELVEARRRNIPIYKRSEVLGMLTREFENTIAVCGTHGKTTVTSMITEIFFDSGADPSAIIGGKLKSIGGSGRVGESEHMIIEACEYKNTYHEITPAVALILNIDLDHMEFFKTEENLIQSFRIFAESATKAIIYNLSDERTARAVDGLPQRKISFGWETSADFYPQNIVVDGLNTTFDIYKGGEIFIEGAEIHVPGRHNVLNAVASAAAADLSGISAAEIKRALGVFTGAGRRFEFLGESGGVTFVDDYAHHPAEIEPTLKAAKELGFKRVWAVHQPFTFTRTKRHLDEFARVLSIADRVVLTEIMGGREQNDIGVFSAELAEKISPDCQTVVIADYDDCASYVVGQASAGDLVITLGCGDVNKIADKMVNAKNRG